MNSVEKKQERQDRQKITEQRARELWVQKFGDLGGYPKPPFPEWPTPFRSWAHEEAYLEVASVTSAEAKALDRICSLLDGQEWDSDTTEAIAQVIEQTGRPVRDPSWTQREPT